MTEKVRVTREVAMALEHIHFTGSDEKLNDLILLYNTGFSNKELKAINEISLTTFVRCLLNGYEEDSPEKEIEDLYETHYKTKLMDNISDEGKNVSRGICYAIEIMNEKFDLKLNLNGATEID